MIRFGSPVTTSPSPARGAFSISGQPARCFGHNLWQWFAGAFASMLIGVVLLGATAPPLAAQADGVTVTGGEQVYVVPIRGTIEPGIAHFLERSLDEAEEAGASVVVLDINTPGGRLDTVLQMREMILESPVKVVAFVNREAFSAGALITIASGEIWMAPAAVFGAATPVLGSTGETADEKTVSAVRSTFRATAEERGRDPLVAEAMVDPAVVVEGLDSADTLLTLSVEQAQAWGYADGVAEDVPALLAALGLGGATVTEMQKSPIEHIVRWVTDPLMATVLITLGLFLIVADALFAGFGIAAAAGAACLGLFFWGHLLAGFAGWEDLLLIGIGIALIAVEIFVIPGFGFAGISGIVALAAGLVLSMTGRNVRNFELTDEVIRSGWVVAISLGIVLVAVLGFAMMFPHLAGNLERGQRGFSWLALSATVDTVDERRRVETPGKPGWLVRLSGGQGVLERDDLQLPDGPDQTSGKNSTRPH